LKKPYLLLCLLLILILVVSCSGVPKGQAVNNEQVTVNSEQAPTELAIAEPPDTVELSDSAESASERAEINQPETIAEEAPAAEYVGTLSVLPEPQEIARKPEAQSAVAMETLRPSEPVSSAKSVSPAETVPKPAAPPALPERRTAQPVPPVQESWRQLPPPKDEAPAIVQEPPPVVEEQPEERILQPDYPITFSRVARVTVGQLVEIPFRGRDWVFIGEVGARRGIAYDSRKLDPEGESFIFRVEASGVYALKFYRQDFAHDLILNDHVQIIAGRAPETAGLTWFNPPVDRSRVVAGPRWPNFLEPQLIAEEKEIAPVNQRELPTTETKQTDAKTSQPPVTVHPPVVAQPPVVVLPPKAAQPPVEAVKPPPAAPPPAAVQPPARQPSATRNEAPRPQGLSGGAAVAQSSPEQPQPPSPPPDPPPPAAEPINPDSLLKQAREEFSAGRIAAAIALLDQFHKFYPSGSDEAWWLYGQCYEANSPNRNMLAALDYYRRLVREYPQSSRLSDARRRISYLERYYINIQ
jgi:TolA-binding protein